MTNGNSCEYIINLSENCLISLVLSALEAYAIRHQGKRKNGLETFGSLFGYETKIDDGPTIYTIELASVDTSSTKKRDSVDYQEKALILKKQILRSFWPHLSFLGDFHTHIYPNRSEMPTTGQFLSEGDRRDLQRNEEFWKELDSRLSLVLTVSTLGRSGSKAAGWEDWYKWPHCIQFTMANTRIWIAGYCLKKSEEKIFYTSDKDSEVILYCPSLTGFYGEWLEFGRIKHDRRGNPTYKEPFN